MPDSADMMRQGTAACTLNTPKNMPLIARETPKSTVIEVFIPLAVRR